MTRDVVFNLSASKLLICTKKIYSFLISLGPIPLCCVVFVCDVIGDIWNSHVYKYLD